MKKKSVFLIPLVGLQLCWFSGWSQNPATQLDRVTKAVINDRFWQCPILRLRIGTERDTKCDCQCNNLNKCYL